MSEDKRSEKEILSNIEDYSRATMKSSERTALNVAFLMWAMVISVVGTVVLIAMNS